MLDPVDIDEKQFFLSEVITSFILVPGEVLLIHLCKHKSCRHSSPNPVGSASLGGTLC